ncbi:MAG TPA: PfkB family carbohydrate kinase [Amycolatopsis sp.]|uniref:PfkB family carbohydrate kinase n=1 Tax=Amycolatopsis sp. TaxID=37632 RepID=UPI002B482883|nr:PfkB family carbohydrate kinase [Amycolatopsis sp.]HKS44371.1 PfkB family carbohydrate kinase [Amycolatopsis sp.]
MDAVVLGQIARDLVLRVPDAPDAGHSALVRSRREMLGGKGANQAVGLAQLGMSVALIGVVGDDHAAAALLARAEADRVDVSHVTRRSGAQTALIVDVVDDHGQWRYLEHVPDEVLATERDVFAASELIRSARSVIVQLRQPTAAALEAARLAHAVQARVVLDGVPTDKELLAYANVLRADGRETAQLAGREIDDVEDAVEVGKALINEGIELAVLEVPGKGNVFANRTGHEFLPLTKVPKVDTTGAGDALVATLTWALTHGERVRAAARLAVAAAAVTTEHAGGRPHLDPAELEALA